MSPILSSAGKGFGFCRLLGRPASFPRPISPCTLNLRAAARVIVRVEACNPPVLVGRSPRRSPCPRPDRRVRWVQESRPQRFRARHDVDRRPQSPVPSHLGRNHCDPGGILRSGCGLGVLEGRRAVIRDRHRLRHETRGDRLRVLHDTRPSGRGDALRVGRARPPRTLAVNFRRRLVFLVRLPGRSAGHPRITAGISAFRGAIHLPNPALNPRRDPLRRRPHRRGSRPGRCPFRRADSRADLLAHAPSPELNAGRSGGLSAPIDRRGDVCKRDEMPIGVRRPRTTASRPDRALARPQPEAGLAGHLGRSARFLPPDSPGGGPIASLRMDRSTCSGVLRP